MLFYPLNRPQFKLANKTITMGYKLIYKLLNILSSFTQKQEKIKFIIRKTKLKSYKSFMVEDRGFWDGRGDNPKELLNQP